VAERGAQNDGEARQIHVHPRRQRRIVPKKGERAEAGNRWPKP
jgi:hypothetical protein